MLTMCMVLSLFAAFVVTANAETPLTWKDGQIKDPADSTGRNWKFDNAYGYTFVIDADKKIGGEDNVLIETVDEYKACNPNWAISVLLKPAGDLYEVVTVVATPGTADKGIEKGIAIENGNIVLVAHSSASYSAEDADPEKDFDKDGNYKYFNWQTKLAALALKAGDKVKVADDKSSVYVLIPGVDDKPAVTVENVNVALNKTSYTTSQLFRQNEQWTWGDDSPIAYPDEDGKTLTDGVFAPDNKHELYDADGAAWMGFHALCPDYKENGYAWIKLDLGASYDITEVVLYTSSSLVSVAKASKVTVLVSADGETWNDFGEVEVVDDATKTVIKNSVTGTANARYVQYKFTAAGYWLGVCEAEVYANVAVEGGSATVKEEIAVDGDLTDTGWAKDKWTTVSGDNGSWQYPTKKEVAEGAVIPTFTYDFQLRADDTKLYGAVVLDGVHEDGKNIKVRVWFRDNDEATVYSSFYDFVLAPDGTLETAAKYNQSTTENKGAVIEGTTLNAAAKVVDGKTVFEFSVDVAEVTKDGNFDYFVSLERKQGVNTGTLYFPYIPEKDETSPHGNYPWLLWMAENDASANVEDIALGEVVVGGEEKEEADTSKMGTAPADPAFTVTVAAKEGWKAGEKLVVTATVDVLKDGVDLSQIMFNLYYDAADVEIVLPEDLGTIITAGKDTWKEDSLFVLSTDGDYGVIECAPATTAEADILKKGDQLVMTFEFTVKDEAEGLVNFQLSNNGLVAYSWDLDAAEVAGAGSSIAVANADALGDTGIYVIAALALVALIGTAVVIKKRA